MASVFTDGEIGVKTAEQRMITRIAERPNSNARDRHKSGPCVTVYKMPEKPVKPLDEFETKE